jgi:hypothetical protein
VAYLITNGQGGISRSLIIMSTFPCRRGKGRLFHKISYEIRIYGKMGSGFRYLKYLHCRPLC